MREWTQEEADRHNALTKQAWSLIENELLIHDRFPSAQPNWLAKRRLNKAIENFRKALEINPESWSSMWALGKIHQRLKQREEAFLWFSRAYEANPENPDVCREAGLEALDLGKAKEAIDFCETAVRLSPDDFGLMANLAWAYLIANRIQDAQTTIGTAVQADPQDQISQSVARIIDEVASGTRPVPKTLLEISQHG